MKHKLFTIASLLHTDPGSAVEECDSLITAMADQNGAYNRYFRYVLYSSNPGAKIGDCDNPTRSTKEAVSDLAQFVAMTAEAFIVQNQWKRAADTYSKHIKWIKSICPELLKLKCDIYYIPSG